MRAAAGRVGRCIDGRSTFVLGTDKSVGCTDANFGADLPGATVSSDPHLAMPEPFVLASTAIKLADQLDRWYASARLAAKTREAQDAAALVYFAAVLASAIAALDLGFRRLLDDVKKLDSSWSPEQRIQLADKVHELGTTEERLKQLKTAIGFLADREGKPGWRDRILGKGDAKLNKALDDLVTAGREVLRMIGADRAAVTPWQVFELEGFIRTPEGGKTVAEIKTEAETVLGVINRLTARSVPEAFGRFASAVSRKHGIPAPDWASVH